VSVPLYMDVQIPSVITIGLRLRGIDVLTAQEDGSRQLPDPQLLDRASSLGRVVFTEDKHFLSEAARRQREGIPFSGVLFAHQLDITISACIDFLELVGTLGEPGEFANRVEYLPFPRAA
jgi:hypothetical protein